MANSNLETGRGRQSFRRIVPLHSTLAHFFLSTRVVENWGRGIRHIAPIQYLPIAFPPIANPLRSFHPRFIRFDPFDSLARPSSRPRTSDTRYTSSLALPQIQINQSSQDAIRRLRRGSHHIGQGIPLDRRGGEFFIPNLLHVSVLTSRAHRDAEPAFWRVYRYLSP